MNYTLLQGDCLDVMKTLEPQSIDAIICDPPFGTTNCAWDSVIPFAPMWECIKHVIKPRCAVVLFGSQPFTSALVMSNPKWYRHQWIWDKGNSGSFANAQYAPLKYHEEIIVFSRKSPTYNPQYIEVGSPNKRRGTAARNLGMGNKAGYSTEFTYKPSETARYPSSIVTYSSGAAECNSLNRLHPTQKPVDLMAYLIKTYTKEGETVLDFTFGSGTTGVACMETGRNFIGIEQDANYFAIAEKRIEAASRQANGQPRQGKATDFDDMPLFADVTQ